MALPLKPPIEPQLARSRSELPGDDGWAFEPKWDGFRTLAYVDGEQVYLQSRTGKPLARYFPELQFAGGHHVLDGELVVLGPDGKEDFDALQSRQHPAQSRIDKLAAEIPAGFLVFDLLAVGDEVLLSEPFAERRKALEKLAPDLGPSVALTPLSTDRTDAGRWLTSGEGVVAKQLDSPYRPGKREGWLKIKRVRTADCVVMGWRPGKEEGTVGSLILGMYDGDPLTPVGHSSGLKAAEKRALVAELEPYETGERGAGAPSRWTSGRDLEWVELRPELVVEVSFDHVASGRIRTGTKILRWRTDKQPRECTVDQLSS
jgi:ATP-dependent DNA ligase